MCGFDVAPHSADRALVLFYGVATGMLLYIVLFGFPRIAPAVAV